MMPYHAEAVQATTMHHHEQYAGLGSGLGLGSGGSGLELTDSVKEEAGRRLERAAGTKYRNRQVPICKMIQPLFVFQISISRIQAEAKN